MKGLDCLIINSEIDCCGSCEHCFYRKPNIKKNMKYIFKSIIKERIRQHSIWGEQNRTPAEWISILGEEFGEVCKEVQENFLNNKSLDDYRTELIQVAAVAVQMIECLERNRKDKE